MEKYLFPEPLVKGATIGVIAPASVAKRKLVAAGLEYLRNKGYQLKIAPNLSRGKFYIAGNDQLRKEFVENFWRHYTVNNK